MNGLLQNHSSRVDGWIPATSLQPVSR
jgi:hypothetical protein